MNDMVGALRDLVRIVEQLGLSYAVIGGIAVRAYKIPRPTYDLDFVVAISRARLAEIFDALEERGYTIAEAYQQG